MINFEKIEDMSIEEILNTLINLISENRYDEEKITMKLYQAINKTPIDYKQIYLLLPYLEEEDLSVILKYDKDYSIPFLLSIVDFADEDDLTKQAIYLLRRYNLNYIFPLLPYVDEDEIREEYNRIHKA